MTTHSKFNFHSIETYFNQIDEETPKTREDVIKQILTCNDPDGLKRFMAQTNEKCFTDVKKAMGLVGLSRRCMGELTGVQCNSNFYWNPERLGRKKGYKEAMGTIYLNCHQNPHLFEELRTLRPAIKKTNFTEKQTEMLTSYYNINQQPSIAEREEIIVRINAMTPDNARTEHSVRVWFAARRRRDAEANADLVSKLLAFMENMESTSTSSTASSSRDSTPLSD